MTVRRTMKICVMNENWRLIYAFDVRTVPLSDPEVLAYVIPIVHIVRRLLVALHKIYSNDAVCVNYLF